MRFGVLLRCAAREKGRVLFWKKQPKDFPTLNAAVADLSRGVDNARTKGVWVFFFGERRAFLAPRAGGS
jgi:hypothetical protein